MKENVGGVLMIHFKQQKLPSNSACFIKMIMTQLSHYCSFWLLSHTYVSEESVTGSAREVSREQRWERKSVGVRPNVCLRTDGRMDGENERERGRGKTFSSGLSCSRESHLGKCPSAY